MIPKICFYFPQNAIYFVVLSFPLQMIYLLTAVWLTPGGSSTVHIYTQTTHRTTQSTQTVHRTTQLNRTTQLTQRTTQLTFLVSHALQLKYLPWEVKHCVEITSVCNLVLALRPQDFFFYSVQGTSTRSCQEIPALVKNHTKKKHICYERPTCELYVTLRVFVGGGKCFRQQVQGIMKLLCKYLCHSCLCLYKQFD